MKRSFCFSLLMASAMIFSPGVYAGGKGKNKGKSKGSTETHAEHRTEWMKSNLNLTAEQAARIEALNRDAAARLKAIKDDKTRDEQSRRAEMQRIRDFFDAEIRIILTPEQRTKYEGHKCEGHGHGKKGKGKAKGHHKCCCHHHDD